MIEVIEIDKPYEVNFIYHINIGIIDKIVILNKISDRNIINERIQDILDKKYIGRKYYEVKEEYDKRQWKIDDK